MRAGLSFLTALVLLALSATGAQAATISSIAFSADPTEDEPVTVTVSGTSEAGRILYVFRHPGTTACGSTASAEYYGLYSTSLERVRRRLAPVRELLEVL